MLKKIGLMTLAFLLLFTNVALGQGNQANQNFSIPTINVTKPLNHKLNNMKISELQKLNPNDEVRIVVELEGEPAIEKATKKKVKYSNLSESTKEKLENDILEDQTVVKNEIEKQGVNIDYITEFTTVFNGFSAEVKVKDLKTIEQLSEVKNVYISKEYKRPEVKPEMKYSKELVEAQKAWEATGYKGEGMVVGIIDTGIDPTHKDMVLSDSSQAALTKEQVDSIVSEHGLPGKFYTEKVPYGYNYMDLNHEIRDLGSAASMHGMHVAGTVGANGDESNGGIQGVAPEAQLLALKVFGNDPEMQSTFGDVYIKAIDDAIKLGADVINMSLGAVSGFVSPDDPEQQAVKRAVDHGVLMSISAGNSAHFGNGFFYPYASNPDYGVVGDPGVSYESLQVASFENSFVEIDELTYNINDELGQAGYLLANDQNPNDFVQKTFEMVYAGLGRPDDFDGLDVKGKFVLIQRGEIAFVDKALNAQKAGAAGVIIYNNTDGIVNMATDPSITIPQLFMLKVDGDKLVEALKNENHVTITFNGEKTTIPNPEAGKMSDFTSWGLTPNLDFKPEITAPGGDILSTLNDDQYGIMSGTSMAAPHVSGGAALILERVDQEFELNNAERVQLAKNLMMNTGKLIEFGDSFVSPRRQGAGLMQLNAALNTPVVVTESKTNEAKVALKEIKGNDFHFQLKVKNFYQTPVSYQVNGNVQTDSPVNGGGVFVSAPNLFGAMDLTNDVSMTINGESNPTIEVPANGTVTLDIHVTIPEGIDSQLKSWFTNGYWLEGFITFKDPSDTNPTIHVPYVGFKGEWDDAPIFDAPVWEDIDSFYGMTQLVTTFDDELLPLGVDYKTGNIDPNRIAISPNGDGMFDQVVPLLSFLRNAKQVTFSVTDEEGNVLRTYRTENNLRKNYYNSGNGSLYHVDTSWAWDGSIDGQLAKEGQYYIQIAGVIDYPNAEWDTLTMPVILDITKPELDASFDEKTQKVTVKLSDGNDGSGIAYWDILVDGTSILGEDLLTGDISEYQLPKLLKNGQTLTILAYDYAGNYTEKVVVTGEDNQGPDIHVTSPGYFDRLNNREVEFTGFVKDKSGIASLTINGEEADVVYDPEQDAYKFQKTIKFNKDGYYENIKIEATDNAGNASEVRRILFIDTTAPKVNVKNVKKYVNSTIDSMNISLHVKDNFDELRVLVNGNEIYYKELSGPFGMKPFEHTIENIVLPLKQESNTFGIKVTDLAGNETIETFTVTKKELPAFIKEDGKTYYYNNDGTMHTGWLEVNHKKYYFDLETGVMATGEVIIDGKTYIFDSNGVLQQGPTDGNDKPGDDNDNNDGEQPGNDDSKDGNHGQPDNGKDGSDQNNNNGNQSNNEGNNDTGKKPLPSTATNLYNFLATGIVFMLLSFGLYLYSRKNNRVLD